MTKSAGKCIEPISMATWDFDVDFNEIVAKKVEAIVTEAFEETPPELSIPVLWGYSEGLEIDVEIPLGPYSDVHARYRFDLREVVTEEIDIFRCRDGTVDEPENIAKMARDLRALADWLDSQLTAKTPVTPQASQKPAR